MAGSGASPSPMRLANSMLVALVAALSLPPAATASDVVSPGCTLPVVGNPCTTYEDVPVRTQSAGGGAGRLAVQTRTTPTPEVDGASWESGVEAVLIRAPDAARANAPPTAPADAPDAVDADSRPHVADVVGALCTGRPVCRSRADVASLPTTLPAVRVHQPVPQVAVGAPALASVPDESAPGSVGSSALGAASPRVDVHEDALAPPGGGPSAMRAALALDAAPLPGASVSAAGDRAAVLAAPPATPVVSALLVGLGLVALAVPLYRRLVRHQVLEHPLRQRMLEEVRAQPGMTESALARALGIQHTLAVYHLRLLVEFGLVERKRFGGRTCLFAAGALSRDDKALALAQGRARELLGIVGAAPGIAQQDLARALGLQASSVKWHLDRLEGHGLLRTERGPDGKKVWATVPLPPPGPAAPASGPQPLATPA